MAEAQPVIIKKIKKGGHAAHGGAWKIAYADFVTAMMAFFLLLWLLNSVTQEQLEGISNYFAPVAASQSQSGSGGVGGGTVISEEGAMRNVTSRPKVTMDLPPPRAGQGPAEDSGQKPPQDLSDQAAEELLKKKEEQQFKEAEKTLQEAIEAVPSLKNLAKSLLIDNTPEGLRIQIVDQEGLAMFASGSAKLYLHTKKVLELVAKVIMSMPQKISISGHTDATQYTGGGKGYSNWELSADRANSARRYLIHRGVPAPRVNRVVGKAETEPLQPDNPNHASNRRLSIILLRGTGRDKKPEDESLPGLSKAKEAVGRGLPADGGRPDDGMISSTPRGPAAPEGSQEVVIPLGPAPKPAPAPPPGVGNEVRIPLGPAKPAPAPPPGGGNEVRIPLGPAKPAPAPAPAGGGNEVRIPLGPAKPAPAPAPSGGNEVRIPLGPAKPAPAPAPSGGGNEVRIPLGSAKPAPPAGEPKQIVIPLGTPKK